MAAPAASVPKKVEEALFYRLKQAAFQRCRAHSAAYADCCRGRTLSVAWACRAQAAALSECMAGQ